MNRAPFTPLIASLTALDLAVAHAGQIEALLCAADLNDESFASFARFLPERYTRNCVYRDEFFELLVLCWANGARSPIHDHGDSRCFVKVQRGSLTVENYRIVEHGRGAGHARLLATGEQVLNPGAIDTRRPDGDVHRVAAQNGPAVSLHVYTPPLDWNLVFDLSHNTCRRVVNHYDTPPPNRIEGVGSTVGNLPVLR